MRKLTRAEIDIQNERNKRLDAMLERPNLFQNDPWWMHRMEVDTAFVYAMFGVIFILCMMLVFLAHDRNMILDGITNCTEFLK